MVEVHPLTAGRLADLDALFGTNKTTAGGQCMWLLVPSKQCHDGWGEVNRTAFASITRTEPAPTGLLAYRDGEPVGWVAAGPRLRYSRALLSPILEQRAAAEDGAIRL